MMTFRSTGRVSPPDGRARLSRLLTILAARNVCRSIFSSSCVLRIVRLGSLEQHLREARDAGERRVDLVRDAGGQQADGRHLLRQPQLLLEVRAIGDVLDDENPAGLRAVGGLERRNRDGSRAASRWSRRPRRRAARGTAWCRRATRAAPPCSVSTNGRLNSADDRRPERAARASTPDERLERAGSSAARDPPRSTTTSAVGQRLDDAVAELPEPLDLVRLAAELAVEPRVLERRGRLAGDGAEQRSCPRC